jgi:hypothetical protein
MVAGWQRSLVANSPTVIMSLGRAAREIEFIGAAIMDEVCCFITNLPQKDAKCDATFMPLNLIQFQRQNVLSSENSEISTVISDYYLQSCR